MAHIAVLDDDDLVRDLMTEVLEGRGYSVSGYADLASARSGLADASPDLIVVDRGLPDGDGLELVGQLHRLTPGLPVLIVSGRGSEEDLMTGFEAGAADYVVKPVANGELLAKVAMLLSRSKVKPAAAAVAADGRDLPGGAGRAFGAYRIVGAIGRGSSATVYDAVDVRSDAEIALKVLDPAAADDAESCQRFLRETYSLSLVRNPRVVTVHDCGAVEGRPYCAMERVRGPTLKECVKSGGPLPAPAARALLRGLGETLEALEAAGLVHRDIKPSNIVLRDGDPAAPVLLDFGLARRPLDRTLTAAGTFLGTPAYTSPEAILGQDLDARSDQFSAGLVVRFALCGAPIFPDLDGLELLRAIVSRPVNLPRAVPGPLRDVLARMVQIRRSERYPSAEALLAALADEVEVANG